MTHLECISRLVNINGDVNDPNTLRPLLSLEEFFTGNDVYGSICCSVTPEQSPQSILNHLRKIRDRNDVNNVLIEITMFDDPEWPFSDKVLIITSATPAEVQNWFDEEIAPDECWEGWSEGTDYGHVIVPPGMKPVSCWWD